MVSLERLTQIPVENVNVGNGGGQIHLEIASWPPYTLHCNILKTLFWCMSRRMKEFRSDNILNDYKMYVGRNQFALNLRDLKIIAKVFRNE